MHQRTKEVGKPTKEVGKFTHIIMQNLSHVKESRNLGKLLLAESGILGFGIQKNPSFTEKESEIQYLESEIHWAESRIQDCPGFPYMGRQIGHIMLISQSQFP